MKTRTLLTIIVAFCLSLVTAQARQNTAPAKSAPPATRAEAATPKKNFFQRLFSRSKDPQPKAAAAIVTKPKPKPAVSTVVRRSSGVRSARPASVAKVAAAAAPAKSSPKQLTAKAAPKQADAPADDILAKAPAAEPIDTSARAEEYSSSTTLGKAMRQVLANLSEESTRETEVTTQTVHARVTAYSDGDKNSAAGKSTTPGVPLQNATESQIGVAAGPAELLGSYVIVERGGRTYRYLIADTGTAVEKRAASRGTAPVIDLYDPEGQSWPDYQRVEIVQIKGASHLLLAAARDRDRFLSEGTFRRALALAEKS